MEQRPEAVEADLRPRLEPVSQRGELPGCDKAQVANGLLARLDVHGIDLDEVDHAEVDAADVVAVVVEQGGNALPVAAGDDQFLVQFAFDRAEVSGLVEMLGMRVAVVDVPADADGHFGMQARFAPRFSAGVAKDAVTVVQDKVGNQLLVRRVIFGRAAGQEEVVGRVEEGLDVGLGFEGEAIEGSQTVENGAGDDKDVFFGGHKGGG